MAVYTTRYGEHISVRPLLLTLHTNFNERTAGSVGDSTLRQLRVAASTMVKPAVRAGPSTTVARRLGAPFTLVYILVYECSGQ
jgi:hypothetical protein